MGMENRFSDVIIRRIFMLGVSTDLLYQDSIDEEYARNKDLVQAEFIDSYYNNTIKTMMSFKWVVENCPKAQFIMFADDDMYVSTKNLLKFIRNPFNKRGIVAKKCGISPLHNEHFYFWRKPYSEEAYSNVIASHGFDDPDELKKVWEEQRSLGHA
ncbi:beta-1,3-galactosyltransferase brn [Caerostris extrusa]|uniref:Hexosyltransferase n=1 Tax=Caerostris extrusa TaxID=172846 RepID=A0AAV4SPN5_CAEEX|nr:beta-1,3-galactosyltransferase brn [Caerostris extrusa]